MTIDNKLSFGPHFNKICKKRLSNTPCVKHSMCQTLHMSNTPYVKHSMPLQEIQLTFHKRNRMIMRVFITSQFSYCALACMCHTVMAVNNKINETS